LKGPDSGASALFIADVHLRSSGADERQERLEKFLDHFAGRVETLFILGDLFDYWMGNLDDYREQYDRVFEALGRFAQKSRIVFLHGNRDIFIGDRLPRGIRGEVHWDAITRRLGRYNVYLCHGHLLCTADKGVRFLERAFHNRFTLWVNNQMPIDLRLYYTRGLRRFSDRAKPRKAVILKPDEEAMARVFSRDIDVIVSGHFHQFDERKFQMRLGAGEREKRLFLLGEWSQGCPYLLFDGERFSLGNFGG